MIGRRRHRDLTVPRFTLTTALFLGGVALSAILIWRVGAARIGQLVFSIGWGVVLLPLPFAFVALCETFGWWFAFARSGCPLRYAELLRFNVAAKAIQHVTPSMSQARGAGEAPSPAPGRRGAGPGDRLRRHGQDDDHWR
jgi:hypothetical protein